MGSSTIKISNYRHAIHNDKLRIFHPIRDQVAQEMGPMLNPFEGSSILLSLSLTLSHDLEKNIVIVWTNYDEIKFKTLLILKEDENKG